MPRLRTIQNSMTAGELDPLLRGRTDIKHYFSGLDKARNVFLLPQGGARRRAGFDFIDTLPTVVATGALSESRCVPFVFSTTQSYRMIFCDLKILVYLEKTLVATITSPYGTADMAGINWTQSLDTMYIFHAGFAPYSLVRGGDHATWTLAILALDSAPRYQFTAASSNPATTLTPSAVTGTVNLTAGAAVFSAPNVGQYVNGNGGRARIVSFTSTTVVKAYMETPFFDTTAIASGDWDLETGYEDAWSATRGWPISGSFHQGRLVIGGARDLPMTMWLSKVNDFTNFDLGTNLDDEGIAVTLASDDVAAIRQVYSGRHLQIFTSSAEFFVPSTAAITPNSIEIRRTTNFGAAEGLRVWNVDGATIFVNRTGGAIREFLFVDTEQAYHAESLSLLASHLVVTPVDTAFRKSTSTEDADYLLVINSDGTMGVMNTLRTQNITGWSLVETQGLIKSVGVELDTMYFVVERTINGTAVMHIEYFDNANALDASTVITAGLPTDTFTGLDHLNGETVEVIADGNRLTPVLVSGGSATIERDAETSVEFGIRFKATGDDYTIKTMPIERELQDGTMIGRKKRVVEVTLDVNSTKSMKVNNNRIAFRQLGEDLLDSSTPSFTGQKVIEGLLGWSDEAQIEIGDDVPLPATINSLAYKVAV